MDVYIYVEGGSPGANHAACRTAFHELFRKLGLARVPRVVACGGRSTAYDKFKIALANEKDRLNILLVDSEDSLVSAQPGERHPKWRHVKEREGDKWDKPRGATDDHLYYMVTATESWLLADPEAISQIYKNDYAPKHLPKVPVDSIPRDELVKHLKKATSDKYVKRHAFDVLALVNPTTVAAKSPSAQEFFEAIRRYTN